MSKYVGNIVYGIIVEDSITKTWINKETSIKYKGDTVKNRSISRESDKINDDRLVSTIISIIADEFAYGNFMNILYVEYMGSKWKISSVEVQRPRLLLTLGGLYNA